MLLWFQSLDSQLAQERIDTDHLKQLLSAAKEKADRDKEALKKATRYGMPAGAIIVWPGVERFSFHPSVSTKSFF